MCLTCSCGEPLNDHGDKRHITMVDLHNAAEAAGITDVEAVGNLVTTALAPPPTMAEAFLDSVKG